jgi:hypothetical protein
MVYPGELVLQIDGDVDADVAADAPARGTP